MKRKNTGYFLMALLIKGIMMKGDSGLENKIENEIQEIENIQSDTTIVKKKNYLEDSCKNYYQVH